MAKIISGQSSSNKLLEQSIPSSDNIKPKKYDQYSIEMSTLSQTERISQSTAQKLNRINLTNKFRQIAFCPHVPLRECPLEIQPAPPNKKNPLLKMLKRCQQTFWHKTRIETRFPCTSFSMIEEKITFAFLLISLLFFERWTLELFFLFNVRFILPSELYQ